MEMETNDRPILIFEEAIKSEETRRQYRYLLEKFVEFVKKEYSEVLNASDLLQLNDNYLQKQLEDYLIFCKKRVGHSSIKVRFAALELFFAMNDRVLNFKKIRKMFPQKIKVLGGHAWTTSEIQKILESTTSLRSKAIIHLLSSTGCRIGALQNLRLENISQMSDNCRSILFYEGSNDEYYGFLTPESSNALEEYFEERRKNGEYLNLKSPLFRKDYRKLGISKAEPMNLQTYRTSLFSILSKVQTSKGENRRHDTPMFHGFRIRFNTVLKKNKEINPNIAERLMGHFSKTIPLDTSYFKPIIDDLFIEFRKAVIELTIDDSERLTLQNKIKDEKINKLETEKDVKITELENKLKHHTTTQDETDEKVHSLEEMTRDLAERLQKQESINDENNKIHIKIKETMDRESNPLNPHFPDGSPLDTKLINLELREFDEKSMAIFDSEFEESINVVLRKNKVYCTLDKSTTCKHVLFALGNPDFYRLVKKNNADIVF